MSDRHKKAVKLLEMASDYLKMHSKIADSSSGAVFRAVRTFLANAIELIEYEEKKEETKTTP